jgi:hypothetical protein
MAGLFVSMNPLNDCDLIKSSLFIPNNTQMRPTLSATSQALDHIISA